MEAGPVWEARHLIDKLEDPFTMFPLDSVSDTLFAAVAETETQKAERRGCYAPLARKYWSVEDEHDHDTIGLFLGAMFVLGQAAITQTVSILNRLRMVCPTGNDIPADKKGKLQKHAAIETRTNQSKLIVINAVSNYFKHSYEWSEGWSVEENKFKEAETMRIVSLLGMSPQSEMTDNLVTAADCLGLHSRNPRAVAATIQEWREAWAMSLYTAFALPDPTRQL